LVWAATATGTVAAIRASPRFLSEGPSAVLGGIERFTDGGTSRPVDCVEEVGLGATTLGSLGVLEKPCKLLGAGDDETEFAPMTFLCWQRQCARWQIRAVAALHCRAMHEEGRLDAKNRWQASHLLALIRLRSAVSRRQIAFVWQAALQGGLPDGLPPHNVQPCGSGDHRRTHSGRPFGASRPARGSRQVAGNNSAARSRRRLSTRFPATGQP